MNMKLGLLVSLCLVLTAGGAFAGIITVPGDYTEIHDAVQACSPGDTVLVDPGTYEDCTHETEGPGSTPACVIMKTGVTLMGSGPEATIVNADSLGRGIFMENISDCRVENLQITRAFAEVYGAGILVRGVDSSVELRNLKIYKNYDGGIICFTSASPVIESVDFIENYAKQGGGLAVEEDCLPAISDCLFDGNCAPSGGGLFMRQGSHCSISDCDFLSNFITADYGAGGGICVVSSSPTIDGCLIQGNSSRGYGGGVAFMGDAAGSITNSTISENWLNGPGLGGGGIHTNASSPLIEGCLVQGNWVDTAWGEGGGIDVEFANPPDYLTPTIRNCTIDGNATSDDGFGGGICFQYNGNATVEYCIVSNTTQGQGLYCISAVPDILCSDIWNNAGGNDLCGNDLGNNFSLDPLFCGTEDVEFNLELDSPCGPNYSPCGELVGSNPVGCTVGADELPVSPARLLGNAPNPFNPKTRIFFVLDQPGIASLRVYDVSGKTIAQFNLGHLDIGQHELSWDGRDRSGEIVSSGVYFYELNAFGLKQARRMILVK